MPVLYSAEDGAKGSMSSTSVPIPSLFSLFLRASYNLCKNIKATAQHSHLLLQWAAIMIWESTLWFFSTDICCLKKKNFQILKGKDSSL